MVDRKILNKDQYEADFSQIREAIVKDATSYICNLIRHTTKINVEKLRADPGIFIYFLLEIMTNISGNVFHNVAKRTDKNETTILLLENMHEDYKSGLDMWFGCVLDDLKNGTIKNDNIV